MHSLISLLDQNGGKGNLVDMEQMLAGIVPLAPVLDAIPTAVIFIKDAKARYLFANRTLVQRCGVKRLDFLLGKTSAEVFPEQLGAAYTEQDERVLRLGIALEEQLELHLFGSREPGWCITHKRPIFNRNEQIIGLVGISSDLQSASDSDPAYQRMAAVDRHIRENFSRPVTMEALTQVAGISTAQLERCCKRIFHLTPRQMIQGPPGTCALSAGHRGHDHRDRHAVRLRRPQRIHPAVQNTDRVYAQSVPRGDTQKEKARRDGS